MYTLEELRQFLVLAKKNTYSSIKANDDISGGNFVYSQGDFFYKDIFWGNSLFIGEEVVYFKEVPIWGMNYYGQLLNKDVSIKDTYSFLRKALSIINIEKPFRGEQYFFDDNYKYINKCNGNIDNFSGKEYIYLESKKIYRLSYHGGIIK